MIFTLETAALDALARFDEIIDVRSPAEFAEDRLPGAVNLPVLSDAQRAEVGEIYVQQSPFLARRIGAAHVARNIAGHLEAELADRPKRWRPLIYCWRGGMRSNAMATVLSQVGWSVTVLKGGYKTWRAYVRRRLYDEPLGLRLTLLAGDTGTAKTELLRLTAERGAQSVDLEGLACHRGSLFGAMPGQPQPSQKLFESCLVEALHRIDPARPVLVEAESSKIGECFVPPSLWTAMQASPRIELSAPLRERARYLARTYADAVQDAAAVEAIIDRLPGPHGKARREAWKAMARACDLEELAAELIEAHYDPAYRRSSRTSAGQVIMTIAADSLDSEAIGGLAARLVEMLETPASLSSGPDDNAQDDGKTDEHRQAGHA